MKKIYSFIFIFLIALTACNSESSDKPHSDYNVDESDIETVTRGNNELAFELLELVEADDNGNVFLSSLSLHMALSMVYNGADTETLTEIGNVLGWDKNNKENLNQAHNIMMSKLLENKAGIELDIANSIWLNNIYEFQDEFKEQTEEYYNAEIRTIDLSDESAEQINDWVYEKTNKKIEDIITPPLNPDLVTLLINTIYFDGNWTYPFNPDATEISDFHLDDNTTVDVNMMQLSEELGYFETDDFQAVLLPYGENEEMNMQIILPNEIETLDTFTEIITEENWQTWQEQYVVQQGTVKLPRFELEYETTLNDTLKELGMPLAFTKAADLSSIIKEPEDLLISVVKQSTYLNVDEEGTEAAAATSVEIVLESAPIEQPFQMEINRPFFLFITDAVSGTILFHGYIQNPAVNIK